VARPHWPALAALWLAAATAVAAELPPARFEPGTPVAGPRVQDLYYGEVLFRFYQDDHFTALTNLLAARSAARLPNHGPEAELLLGGLYLHYGQHLRAEQIFAALLESGASPAVRDRAWFYLGKVRYQRGLHEDALAAFGKVQGELPEALAVQLPMLMAQSQMALGRFDEAAKLLDRWKGPEAWLAYARYNLGVALVRLGRLPEGARQLDRVGRMDAPTPELRDLRDKANVALGYAYLQKSLDGEAAPVLARVRLNGPSSTKALLGAGWAAAESGRFQEALAPWLALRDRDLLDSAVQESLLAVPYAYGQLSAHDVAAGAYGAALEDFDTEIGRLDDAIAKAQNGGLVPALLKADDPGIGRWYWQLDEVPDGPEARYLYVLMADHAFQEGLRNVRDLRALGTHLDDWATRLDAYRDMVDTRRAAYARRKDAFEAGLGAADIDGLVARRDALAARLDAARAGRDVAALATGTERDAWLRLEALEQDAGFESAAAADRDRHRLLKGVLLWDLDRDYKHRLWQQQRELRTVNAALERARRSHARAAGARDGVPADLEAFAARIEAVTPRIAALRSAVDGARLAQEGRLTNMAVAALQDQRERLSAYRVQAQFALATIYDRAAVAARSAPAPPAGKAP
jgi:tetratricopeptide (TPR) repeat protein